MGTARQALTVEWELNSPFRIDEIDVGDPIDDEVQIRVHAAGMCHSDYQNIRGVITFDEADW